MTEWSGFLENEAATVAAGRAVGRALAEHPGAISIHLAGDLGAGKTTFTRGVLQHFGHSGAVKSPTYTLVEVYDLPRRSLYHFDLYRLGDPEELEYMGIRDYFGGQSLCLIEWPSRGEGILPPADIIATLAVSQSDKMQVPGRVVKLEAGSDAGSRLIARVAEQYSDYGLHQQH